jgi:hypothetical protein
MLFQTNKYQKKVVTIDQLQSNLILLIEMAKQNKGTVNMQILLHFNKYI